MNFKTLLYSVILSIGSASAGRPVAGDEYLATGSFTSQVLQLGTAGLQQSAQVRNLGATRSDDHFDPAILGRLPAR